MATYAIPHASPSRSHVLTTWTPENKEFWQREGETIANRNLEISIPCLFLSFAVWQLWSVVAVNLNTLGYRFTTNELFWLAAAPALSGATLRAFYAFLVPIFGGRRWTAISTASLLIPTVGVGIAVQDTSTSYTTLLILALLCGFGGGNFSSSSANISYFFPRHRRGAALGLNSGFGNLGVSAMQLLAPLVIVAETFGTLAGSPHTVIDKLGRETQLSVQNAAFIWVPFILICTVAAWFGMNDIAVPRTSFRKQAAIYKRKHAWLMGCLYLGTFGSFIGYAAGFPLLIKHSFPSVNPGTYAWLGPLIGALARPFGDWLADKLGGASVTFWNFIAMAAAVGGVLYFLPNGSSPGDFTGFFMMFLVLFLTTGIGSGATFRMIPVIFLTARKRAIRKSRSKAAMEQAVKDGTREGAAVLGLAGALGAYGGFLVPKSYGTSIAATGGPEAALCIFIWFYIACIAITWWFYARPKAEMPC